LLNLVDDRLPDLSDTITHQYLSHLQASRHLTSSDMQPSRRGVGESRDHL
jgi:hypothetical protein